MQGHCLLYVAQVSETELILLKFTHCYSINLHKFCANHGHVPHIFGFGCLPGGWLAIAMQYIHPAVHPSKSTAFTTSCEKWATELQALIQAFHKEDFVHGDLCEPNIICNGGKVMVVDFDWGGKEGKAYYPSVSLCDELTNGQGSNSPKITKDDNEQVLNNMLNGLRSKVH